MNLKVRFGSGGSDLKRFNQRFHLYTDRHSSSPGRLQTVLSGYHTQRKTSRRLKSIELFAVESDMKAKVTYDCSDQAHKVSNYFFLAFHCRRNPYYSSMPWSLSVQFARGCKSKLRKRMVLRKAQLTNAEGNSCRV